MLTDEVKYSVLARLELGEKPKDLATEYDISYGAVLRWRREYKEAKDNGIIDKVYDVDRLVLEQAAANLPVPSAVSEAAKGAVENIARALSGLERLDNELQTTALSLVKKYNALTASASFGSELESITKGICDLRSAFFGKNSTQVAIQQNFGGDGKVSESYGDFLND